MELKDNNGQKVEVVVNHQGAGAMEISLIRVFSEMANRKKIYLRLMALLLIIGLILPMFVAEVTQKNPDAQAVITLTYKVENKDKEKPEDDDFIDPPAVSFSSYVLEEALSNTQLSTGISLSALQSNLSVERLLSLETRQRLEILEKRIAANGSSVGQADENKLEYDNTYIITLKNGFGAPDARNKTYLDVSEIQDLLNNIVSSYNNYLYTSLSDFSLPQSDLESIGSNDLDYLENLDIIRSALESLKEFSDEKSELYPEYRSASTGLSFDDLSKMISTISDIDISYLYSYIMLNGISKDPAVLINKYNYTLRNARQELAGTVSRIAANKLIIDNYKNEVVSVEKGDGQSIQTTRINTDYYNDLVLAQTELYANKSKLESTISDLEHKISVFSGTVTSAELALVESEYARVYKDAAEVQDLVLAQAADLQGSDVIKNSYMTFTTAQSGSESFFSVANIKTAVIGGVAGLFIAVCIWFVAGFAAELKRGGKKNEEQ